MTEAKHTILTKQRVPKTIQWLVGLFFLYLMIFTGFRIATIVFFRPDSTPVFELLPACWLGLKYDLRWISFFLLPIAVFSIYPSFSPFSGERMKRFWTYYMAIITLVVFFFYGADFGQFAYVNARLNADALIFAEDPRESLQMVWQSYPVVWILAGLILSVFLMTNMFHRIHAGVEERNSHIHKFTYKRRWHLTAILMLVWFMYGFLTKGPLDFYRAFNLNDEFKSNLALNPFQNFFTTLRFREPVKKTKASAYYPVISKFLNLEEKGEDNPYARQVYPGSRAISSQPNIVLVICESFSMYKSSMSGNKLDATPYFDSLCRSGIFFEKCFTPSFGTARGVFAILTGIPDVQLGKFSTRNEESVRQRTIINDFEGYNKFYFIGGRSNFNNLNGLIRNINDVDLYEKGRYAKPDFNVWGISDKDLFLEANNVMARQRDPFFAVIQTAGNHRPFEVPGQDRIIPPVEIHPDTLLKYGFESQKEYDVFTYSDRCIMAFMEAAQKESYFRNTIFVFIGDHGVEGNAASVYPSAWTQQRLSELHVPLLFYAPGFLEPQRRQETVSQIDVLPTIAGMLDQPYLNTTLGRDLFDKTERYPAAFVIQHAAGWIGVVNDKFFYRQHLRIKKDELTSLKGEVNLNGKQQDSLKAKLSDLSRAIYETSAWMLLNNGKKN